MSLDVTVPAPVSQALNVQRLEAWMDSQGLESGPVMEPVLLGGGTQNVIVRFRRGGSQFVLRRPSIHPRANDNETMMREVQVLGALAGTRVLHPSIVASCSDVDVLGVAFYLMEPVEGFCARGSLPALHATSAEVRHRMGLALVEGAAALGAVDHRTVGLARFGKSDGFLQRQTVRWRTQLESYFEYPGWPGPSALRGVDTVQRWLDANIPTSSFEPGIMHGDYHIANVLYRHDGGDLAAIVDWELATIGDPLLDLGWLLATWPDCDGDPPDREIAIRPWSGFPSADELIAHYGKFSTRDLSQVGWYAVLACYKLGIILEGSFARACAGKVIPETGNRLHSAAIRLFERANLWMAAT